MAHTTKWIKKNTVGGKREEYHYITMTSASTTIETGLSWLDFVDATPISHQDSAINLFPNRITSGAATPTDPGFLFVANATTDDYVLRFVGD